MEMGIRNLGIAIYGIGGLPGLEYLLVNLTSMIGFSGTWAFGFY